ncbi:MAG: hypothetical protein NTY65_02875 [Planctomycetota bacterium]|nr:hypothetical protein [Planctomycetota bacterium]
MLINRYGEIVLFYAEESLLYQVAGWARSEGRFSMRLVLSSDPAVVAHALDDAVVAIIDATRQPGEAMAVLERALPRIGPRRVAVYSEQLHNGLEVFVRVRGVTLLAGPMGQPEWEVFFEPLARISIPLAEGA